MTLSAVDEGLATAWRRFCGNLDFVELHYRAFVKGPLGQAGRTFR